MQLWREIEKSCKRSKLLKSEVHLEILSCSDPIQLIHLTSSANLIITTLLNFPRQGPHCATVTQYFQGKKKKMWFSGGKMISAVAAEFCLYLFYIILENRKCIYSLMRILCNFKSVIQVSSKILAIIAECE